MSLGDDDDEETSPEDELDRLVRESFSQADHGSANVSPGTGGGSDRRMASGVVLQRGANVSTAGYGSVGLTANDVMFQKAMTAITSMAEANARAGESTEDYRKVISILSDNHKRKRDEDLDEEEACLIDEMVHIKDNSCDIIDMGIRQRLKNPNGCPSDWWNSSVMEKRCRPIFGQSLYLTHLMPGRINPLTIRKVHDRSVLVTAKSLSLQNSGCVGEKKMVYKLTQTAEEDETILMGGRNYVDCKTVFEVIESVFNLMAVVHQVRPYSYEVLALLRGLHHVKFFFGVTDDAKVQKQLVEKLVGEVWSYNQRRGLENRHPATFKKVVEYAKVMCLIKVGLL